MQDACHPGRGGALHELRSLRTKTWSFRRSRLGMNAPECRDLSADPGSGSSADRKRHKTQFSRRHGDAFRRHDLKEGNGDRNEWMTRNNPHESSCIARSHLCGWETAPSDGGDRGALAGSGSGQQMSHTGRAASQRDPCDAHSHQNGPRSEGCSRLVCEYNFCIIADRRFEA